MSFRPDPSSPVPLYHQIAAEIRGRIAAGELLPGSALEPLREAARRLGVNVHTVRHAYAELARDGWVESRRSQGTRVLARESGRRAPLPSFEAVLERASGELGLSPADLHERLGEWLRQQAQAPDPGVSVVECSPFQCADLARQIEAVWQIDARPWPLSRAGAPGGVIVATYFHYNEIRRRWPARLSQVCFLTIRPDPRLVGELALRGSAPTRVALLERDGPTLEALQADLSVLLDPGRFELRGELIEGNEPPSPGDREIQLFSPRLWEDLPEASRADPRVRQLRYVFDARELQELGARQGWARRVPRSKVS